MLLNLVRLLVWLVPHQDLCATGDPAGSSLPPPSRQGWSTIVAGGERLDNEGGTSPSPAPVHGSCIPGSIQPLSAGCCT